MKRKKVRLPLTRTHWGRHRLPQTDGRLYLHGLSRPVTVHRDKWGIPHIYAANRHDLFFAQGFVHAQDRLWQMEINRRVATGTLSAILGRITLDIDRLTRTLGFYRLAQETWRQLTGRYRDDVLAYTAGVNAFLHSRWPLPLEFALIRHTPRLWQPLDTIAYGRLQMWALTHGAMGELVQAQLIDLLGGELASEILPDYPPDQPVTLPEGIEVNRLVVDDMLKTAVSPLLGKGNLGEAGRGSNGWVIAPKRSATGHAILCNDMHLPVLTPSLWYYVHLHSEDGLHVTGYSQPGLPYVLVGHNAHIAWGATLAYTDCEDFFVEQFDPTDNGRYRYEDGWRQAQIYREVIDIRGSKPHIEEVVVTHHGPVISPAIIPNGQTLTLSSTALLPDATFDGFALLNEARNWDEFVTAVSHIQSPPLNLLYADTNDNIGHYVSGRVPVRRTGDGRLPRPGWNSEYEWDGFIPFDEMPHALNPRQGYIVSANHRITGDNYPHYLGNVWRNGFRAQRIEMLINEQARISIDDCRRFQMDVYNIPGHKLARLLTDWPFTHPDAILCRQLLQSWDGYLTTNSVGGTVYEVLLYKLADAILSRHMPQKLRYRLLGQGPHPLLAPVNEFQGYWSAILLRLLANEQSHWLGDRAERTTIMEQCLRETADTCRRLLGPDPNQWHWGRLHRVTFPHHLGQQPPLDKLFNQGPFPIGGDMDTVAQASIRPDMLYDNNAISVSSRHIVDMGNLSNSWAMFAPGQSGHLASPHYGDLIDHWLNGRYFRMLWTKAEVEAESQHHLRLLPEGYLLGKEA
ncbi:MAG: penicillin acylase family protein [Chloroflexi bacterium]|nr:MAG: penicillin acylase family protein [Chloroflexota bacterium]